MQWRVWKKQHSGTVDAPDQFKTCDQPEKSSEVGSWTEEVCSFLLMKVMRDTRMILYVDHSKPNFNKESVESVANTSPIESKDSDEDDALSYFQKLAEEYDLLK